MGPVPTQSRAGVNFLLFKVFAITRVSSLRSSGSAWDRCPSNVVLLKPLQVCSGNLHGDESEDCLTIYLRNRIPTYVNKKLPCLSHFSSCCHLLLSCRVWGLSLKNLNFLNFNYLDKETLPSSLHCSSAKS